MNKMKLKNAKKHFKIKKITIIFIILLFLLFIFMKISNNAATFFLSYAEQELEKLITTIINTSIKQETFDSIDTSSLFIISKNNNDEIEMVDYNSNMVNEFLNRITDEIQINILKLEKGDFILNNELTSNSKATFYIPLGIIFNNALLNNIGPKIPVKMKTIGALSTNINVSIKEYGINNALIEMTVFIEIKEKIILPLISKEMTITNEVPVSYKIINGKIPQYYGSDGLNKRSNIYSIPIE